ncbi:MAG: 50S ribosomal protein L21 [Chloroflexi bacterium]|nr:50S ribosomal protein L21 [Chloroflexota bacterium]MBI4267426.1 50S ribosomal protein L21 [Chloroflexota bacterium]
MDAIIETGGKQYKVSPGQMIKVDRLNVADGDKVDLDKVLLIAEGDQVTVGTPLIEGAKVIATAREQVRDKKIIVGKFKAKVRYKRKVGHRQPYTMLAIDEIVEPSKK